MVPCLIKWTKALRLLLLVFLFFLTSYIRDTRLQKLQQTWNISLSKFTIRSSMHQTCLISSEWYVHTVNDPRLQGEHSNQKDREDVKVFPYFQLIFYPVSWCNSLSLNVHQEIHFSKVVLTVARPNVKHKGEILKTILRLVSLLVKLPFFWCCFVLKWLFVFPYLSLMDYIYLCSVNFSMNL